MLILLVASIPLAMPAVISITMALGALALSKEKAIVSRLASIEEMAGVDILCSDKTGTLTKNELTLGDPILFGSSDPQDVVLAGALASEAENGDVIDTAVLASPQDTELLKSFSVTDFVTFDPVSKSTQATATDGKGKTVTVAKGAPKAAKDTADKVDGAVADLGSRGYRALGVARPEDAGKSWILLGILPMFDPPRDDSKETIERVRAKGVAFKMITGDDTAIAWETARQLELGTQIVPAAEAFPQDMDPDHVPESIADSIVKADRFAWVFPEHK